jgi:glyoxylate reductase
VGQFHLPFRGNMEKVYSTWILPESAREDLHTYGVTLGENQSRDLLTREYLHRACRENNALITLLTDKIDRDMIAEAPQLRIIANVAAGTDNIDISAAKERGIIVTNTPDVLAEATADLAATVILAAMRGIVPADRFVRSGQFAGWRPDLFVGEGLRKKKVGIFGMGRIGAHLARRLLAFGAHILYHNRQPRNDLDFAAAYINSFTEFVRNTEVLVVFSPLTAATKHLFNADVFAAMPEQSWFFNFGRGAIHVEQDLCRALISGQLAGAGLDVYEHEPEIENELLQLDNVVLLPHIGSAERATREQMFRLAVANVIAVLSKRAALTPVN